MPPCFGAHAPAIAQCSRPHGARNALPCTHCRAARVGTHRASARAMSRHSAHSISLNQQSHIGGLDDPTDTSEERTGRGRFAARDAGAGLRACRRRAGRPTLSSGDTAWMLTSTALVLLMTMPGLSLFYAGMVRSKNALSVMMQCFVITCLVTVLWVVYRLRARVRRRRRRHHRQPRQSLPQRHHVRRR